MTVENWSIKSLMTFSSKNQCSCHNCDYDVLLLLQLAHHDDNVFAVIGLDDDVAHIFCVITMSLLEPLLVTHSWTMSLLEHCTSTMYTMCKLYKQNKQNKHNVYLSLIHI